MRKIIQLIMSPPGPGYKPMIVALCDDGTVWADVIGRPASWQKLDDIPQDDEDNERIIK